MSFNYEEQWSHNDRAQAQAWRDFKAQLERLQDEYRATKTEIIDGLRVTRSKFYSFNNHPDDGLNINRNDILNLWAYLCDIENRRIPKIAEDQRKKLRREGPDPLLKTLGFATQAESGETGRKKNSQVERVLRRLESSWIHDDAVRVYITNKILDQVLDLGQPESIMHVKPVELAQAVQWPEDFFAEKLDPIVYGKYKNAMNKLIRAGKTEFVRAELFELYQSILEHYYLGRSRGVKLRIVDCQFQALSQDLNRYGEEGDIFTTISTEAEKNLIDLLVGDGISLNDKKAIDDKSTQLDIVSTPCLQAKIRYQIEIGDEVKPAVIRYSSTSTHVENMLKAMSRGLGYPLGVSAFSIRATGRTEKSLARISIALSKLKEEDRATTPSSHAGYERIEGVYEGWWVSSNTIIGILNATSDAVTRWLAEESIDAKAYYDACYEATRLTQEFYDLRKALYEYSPHSFRSSESSFEDAAKKLNDETSDYINRYDPDQYGDGFKIHVNKMKDQRGMVLLAMTHAALVAGKPSEAKELLDKASSRRANSSYSSVLSVYHEACDMAHKLVQGDTSFIVGKQWNYDNYSVLSRSLEELGHYIRDVKSIDFDVYLVTSQLFGIVGILDFYSSLDSSDSDWRSYTKSGNLLIQAAHYSSRIGQTRRASQWLSFASRMCTRIGDKTRARKLFRTAVAVSRKVSPLASDETFQLHYSNVSSNWLGVNQSLAQGELALSENQRDEALRSFLQALDIALLVGYSRAIPDCLYNIGRTTRKMTTAKNLQEENPFRNKWSDTYLKGWQDNFNNPAIANIVSPLLKLLRNIDSEASFTQISKKAQTSAADIWNSWHIGKKEHPYAEQIKEWSFLQPLNSQ
ncbi:MAG: hypothetical protein AAFZ17_01330 [Cyanobacteria bacterium J06650_10]